MLDEKYNSASITKTYTVGKRMAVITGIGATTVYVGENSTIRVALNSTESGVVRIVIDGVNYTAPITSGNATLTVALTAGNHSVWAYYDGDTVFNPANAINTTVTVMNKLPSTVVIDKNITLNIDDIVNFTATVNGHKLGQGNITVNGNVLTNINITEGTYTVVATFAGNRTHAGASDTYTFTVSKKDVNLTIDDISLVIGNVVNFTAKLNGANFAGVTVNGGSNINITVTAGTYTVVATFDGNRTHNMKTVIKTFTVAKKNTTMNVPQPAEVYVGQNSIIDIIFNDNITGYVQIEINGQNATVGITNGRGKFNRSLEVGTHEFKVYFTGNTNYNAVDPQSGSLTVKDKETPAIDIIANGTLAVGGNVSFNATVNSHASDLVTIRIDGDDKNNITGLEAKTYTVTAYFAGNATHKAGSASKTFTVGKLQSVIEITALPNTVYVGKTTTITVSLNGNETGFVRFVVDGENYTANIDNHKAVLNVTLGIGNHSVWAYYDGDDTYNPANAVNTTFKVIDKLDSIVKIDNITLYIGEVINFTATVNGQKLGQGNITVNGENRTNINITEGSYNCKIRW